MITGVEFKRANPFRIIPLNNGYANIAIDYINRLPQFDLMRLNKQYQMGVYPTDKKYYPDWKINEQIKIQLWNNAPNFVKIYKTGSTGGTSMTKNDVTPVGWVDLDVYRYSYTPTEEGDYYITFEFEVPDPEAPEESIVAYAITDTFHVSGSLPEDKNLIELQYNSEDYDKLVFQTDEYYKAYYTGIMTIGDSEISVSEFNEDTPAKLASLTYDKLMVVLNDIDQNYYQVILRQLECENLKVNGIPCVFNNSISKEQSADKIGLLNITIEFKLDYDNSSMYFS